MDRAASSELENEELVYCSAMFSKKITASDLPPELLRAMLSFVLPPNFLLEPSSTFVLCSPWVSALRAKKAMTLVCRKWNAVATPLLYEEVNIRRMGQFACLLATLRQVPVYTQMVRRLIVSCYVPDDAQDNFVSGFKEVQELCPRASEMSFSPIFGRNTTARSSAYCLTYLISPSRITVLDLSRGVQRYILPMLFRNCIHLKILSLKLQFDGLYLCSEPPFILEYLEQLELTTDTNVTFPFTQQSRLPALTHVTLEVADYLASSFLEGHGKNLKYLAIPTSSLNLRLDQYCPKLQHLVVGYWERNGVLLEPIHCPAALKYIDFWKRNGCSTISSLTKVNPVPDQFFRPSSRKIRILDCALLPFTRLPFEFPPDEPRHLREYPVRLRYPGIDIEVGETTIWKMDMEHVEEYGDQVMKELGNESDDSLWNEDSSPETSLSEGNLTEEGSIDLSDGDHLQW